jgi:hypothetical protein
VPGSQSKVAERFGILGMSQFLLAVSDIHCVEKELPALVFIYPSKNVFEVFEKDDALTKDTVQKFIQASLALHDDDLKDMKPIPIFPSPPLPKKKPPFSLQVCMYFLAIDSTQYHERLLA